MPLTNTPRSFGTLARALHWLTALLILTAIPLGLIANDMAYDTGAALARKAQLFSLHKSLGIAAFAVALVRILWALSQPRPAGLHPDRKWENLAAEVTHWLLYLSLLIVPLSGWVHHAATSGFAPILWPIGQTLPFVPKSEGVALAAASLHDVFTKLLIASILLHVAGAIKHQLIDRDTTLMRMLSNVQAGPERALRHGIAPALTAVLIYAAGAGLALSLAAPDASPRAAAPLATPAQAGNWHVTEGSLGFSVRQFGSDVQGSFADWTAAITFDETATNGKHGQATVTIAIPSLSLGSVTEQAKAADFFDAPTYSTAIFTADILPAEAGYIARGTLTLRGATQPIALPFTLVIDGDTATMAGSTTLDRRDFGIGASYGDEATIGFGVTITVALTASRAN
ncbi:MAG: cytochrome b/b6 domain-containing protein [Paracoccaceae bacterium]|nr:cytochrome b/b6 domain-containing protein [Paracoccaceae bacterium]